MAQTADLSALGMPLAMSAVLRDLSFVERALKMPKSKRVDEWLHAFAFDDAEGQRMKTRLSQLSFEQMRSDAAELVQHAQEFLTTMLFRSDAFVLCRVQGAPHTEDSREDNRLMQCVHGILGMRAQLCMALDETHMGELARDVGERFGDPGHVRVMLYGFASVLTLQLLAAFAAVEGLAKKLMTPHVMRYEAARNKIRHAARQGVVTPEHEAVLLESLEKAFADEAMAEEEKLRRFEALGNLE